MTTTEDVPAAGPGPRAWASLTVAEAKMVARDTAGLVVPLGLPLLILVMHGLSFGHATTADGVSLFERYVIPLALTIVVAMVGIVNMPSFLVHYRRAKVLRRLAVTPAHPSMILGAQLLVGLVQCVLGVAIGVTVAMLFFDVGAPQRTGTAVAVLGLATLTMFAVGMIVAALAPSTNAAVATGLVMFFAFGALGGMFGPAESLPAPLAATGEMLPFGAAVQAIGAAWVGADQDPAHLIGMGAAVLVSGAIAVRWFRWD